MPNWCENELTIRAKSAEALEVLLATIRTADNGPIDFNNILPMPFELRGTISGSTVINGKTVNVWREVEKDGKRVAVEVDTAELRKKYGFDNWYDWAHHYWNTKWNASEARLHSLKGKTARIDFNTAWSPPMNVVAVLGEKNPELVLTLRYWECGAAYKGIFEMRGGVRTKDLCEKYRGRRGG